MFDIADAMLKKAQEHADTWGEFTDRIIEMCNEIMKLADKSDSNMVRISEYCNNIAERYVKILAVDRELEEAQKQLKSQIAEYEAEA